MKIARNIPRIARHEFAPRIICLNGPMAFSFEAQRALSRAARQQKELTILGAARTRPVLRVFLEAA
jgi:hypothetical protein